MKNKIFKAIALCLALLPFGACNDGCEDYLDEYESILYFKNNGEQHVTIYDTSNEANSEFVVIRAGYNSKKNSSVDVSVLDAVNLQIYNAENDMDYNLLPDDCFTLETTTLEFDSSDDHKMVKVIFKIDKIKELSSANYTLPLVLNNSNDDININKRLIFIVPDIVTPYLYFEKSGYQPYKVEEGGVISFDITMSIGMPMANAWDFDCSLEVNPELLTEYNESNQADFLLLPENCYTLIPKASFISGKSTSNATIKINIADDLKFGKYILPVELTECSMPTFTIKEGANSYLAAIIYQKHIEETELKEIKLTEDMISSNARTEDFESLEARTQLINVIDGDINTSFHSYWAFHGFPSDFSELPYIEVKLPRVYSGFKFSYVTRTQANGSNNGNGNPQELNIYTSEDGVNFTLLNTLSDDLPLSEMGATYESDMMLPISGLFRYLRIESTHAKEAGLNAMAIAELNLWVAE
ncbi:BT_3987 domain-containing protein [Bacteroides reticulotermitis]|uniref:BT_3987 domain-containing protein n=1 Tax=Bacteroides reticulotermitis TaxID=1133319 RepID=UPI001DC636D0|nr:DUF1735 domain-containing protein [Bacteroides reticulotermitis]